ncbi:MAG: TIGR02680 family protein [Steroidobacteraceae bacterium]
MTREPSVISLPEPTRARWQPLRFGLVELYHYDVEEFHFRDGHLLLRGNNGTGKSKVLSLTLPFLLDANLTASRIEPDGDRSKRMEWNLLMGIHERRIGYTWIELGRREAGDRIETLTLGCGLRAVAGRQGVDSWYFITEQRIGAELWLTTAQRTALTRERLIEAIGARGRVFETAHDYKRAVDERLFRLGEERYEALVNTLIQLRQPQLSKQPDEDRLSNALTEALTPLDRSALEDVAESMAQLEQLRRELDELNAMSKAVSAFGGHYRRYAGVASRRRARVLRQAQTAFDDVSRDLNGAEEKLAQARGSVERWRAEATRLDEDRTADSERIRVLETHPTMRDARRIDDARVRAADCREAATDADQRVTMARSRLTEEETLALQRHSDARETGSLLAKHEQAAASAADRCGVDAAHARATEGIALEGVASFAGGRVETLRRELRGIEQRRREQIEMIRKRLREFADAEQLRAAVRHERTIRAEALEAASADSQQALMRLEDAGSDLLRIWRTYIGALQVLRIADPDDLEARLELWVQTLSGANPARAELMQMWQSHEARLAGREASLETQRQVMEREQQEFEAERARLTSGETPVPPVPHTRAPESRLQRLGAPLWQLVDFVPDVPESARAGLEAALEASGILDAWILPDGAVLDPRTHDVLLVSRSAQAHSLARWLAPAALSGANTESLPTPQTLSAILQSIGCPGLGCDAGSGSPSGSRTGDAEQTLDTARVGDEDASITAEAWVSPDGRFRIGPARGAWSKREAQYIGHAARDAARRARLAEIESRLDALRADLASWAAEAARIEALRERGREEQTNAPSEEPLLSAHAERNAAEQTRRQTQERLGAADAKLLAAEQACTRAHDQLTLDAESLSLPPDRDRVEKTEAHLSDYRGTAGDLVNAVGSHHRALGELARQQEREARARADQETAVARQVEKRRLLREAEETVRSLEASIGKAVEELLRDLAEAKDSKEEHEKAWKHANAQLIVAGSQRAAAETRRNDLREQQADRLERRKQAIDELQSFAGLTGLISVAVPDLALPDSGTSWGIEAALGVARRTEQALADVAAEDADWNRIQSGISRDLNDLQGAMSAQGHAAQTEVTDYGLVVRIVYRQRPERPDVLERLLAEDIEDRRLTLSAQEREVLEQHLEKEIAANLQRMMVETEERVRTINGELAKRPTSTGVRYRLDWQPLPEEAAGGVAGLLEARRRLLRTNPDAWSADDRRQVGEFLASRIQAERARDDEASLFESLARALDYRRWHRFRVQRMQDGQWKPLAGPASSGERALGLTVPLFAAASSHYGSADTLAPRLVLLDEAFAGIDDEARANCMGLIREFDLDFVMTSEREWGCYQQLPGLAICQLTRREGMDAVLVTRWTWDGRERRLQEDPVRRFPEDQEVETNADGEARSLFG